MNVSDFMAKHGIGDADLDRMAAPYEDGSFEPEPNGKVFSGSHLDRMAAPYEDGSFERGGPDEVR